MTSTQPSWRVWSRRYASRVGLVAGLLVLAGGGTARTQSAEQTSYTLTNGRWFDGEGFRAVTVHAIDGKLTYQKPARTGRTLDLQGAYVIPPFAEAHNHNLTSEDQAAGNLPRYLREGVFYAKMQSSLPLLTGSILHLFNRPDSVDVVFANGPLTATGGHPVALRERLLEQGVYPSFITRETLNNQGYVLIDTEEDLEKKWATILSFRPDFIKTVLSASEEYQKRKDDPAYFGRKGLNPQLLPKIVAKAHGHGLRASVHVDTAEDFHHAVLAGADEIVHTPGYSSPTLIQAEDARRAAEKGIVVVTTAILALRRRQSPEIYDRLLAAQKANLQLLLKSGVRLAIGSDDISQTSVGEAQYLKELGIFDNRTLLKMWTETAALTIFPKRKIGALREGYEASFLVLDGNPLEDFANVRKIRMRVKQGVLLP